MQGTAIKARLSVLAWLEASTLSLHAQALLEVGEFVRVHRLL